MPKHVHQESNQLLIVSTVHLFLMVLMLMHDLMILSSQLIQISVAVSIMLPDLLFVIDLTGKNLYTLNDIGIMLDL